MENKTDIEFYVGNGPTNYFFNKEYGNKYYIPGFKVDKSDKNSAIVMLCNYVEENSVVLDVGCADGKFGAFLKENKNVTLYGIDINEEAVNQVKSAGIYDDVYLIDMENEVESLTEYNRYINNGVTYDFIILSDIFEHLKDPTKVILKIAERLMVGGKILVSVPNVSHADIWLNLIEGKFNYTHAGILDNTHLKFFTKHSFYEWIDDINHSFKDVCFDCEYIGGTHGEGSLVSSISNSDKFLYDYITSIPEYDTVQLLFVLTSLKKDSLTQKIDDALNNSKVNMIENLSNCFKIKDIMQKELKKTQEYVKEKELIINQLEDEIKTSNEELDNKSTLLQKANAENIDQKYFINYMVNSKSWRLTKGLRWVLTTLKRIKNK